MPEARARIVTELEDLYAVDDLAQLGFQAAGPAWQNRARRLGSASRSITDRWLLEVDGRPVSALLCYPLSFGRRDGSIATGFGLGAVTTHPEARRRGFAAALCRQVAEHEHERERFLGLLFSGIDPRYYGRLGYKACGAWDWDCVRVAELAQSGESAALHPVDPRRERAALARLYQEHHAGMLHLARDAAAWEHSFNVSPDDWWFLVGEPSAPRGYARVKPHPKGLDLHELALAEGQDEAPVLRRLAAMTSELELEHLWTWTQTSEFVAQWFEDKSRASSLPMVLGADGSGRSQFWPSDYF